MTVWVSGATGFLGSHVTAAVVRAGLQVRPVSRSGGAVDLRRQGEEDMPVEPALSHATVHGDSTIDVADIDVLDRDAVRRSAVGCSAAIICTGRVSRDPNDAGLLHQLHVEGTRSQLRALKEAGVRRVVVASTSGTIAVSRDRKRIDDEDSGQALEHIASLPYYRSKYFGEKEALAHVSGDFEVVIVNPSLLLGPGDLRESSTSDVRRFLEGALAAAPAGGMAYVDVRDVATAMVAALTRGNSGERYLLNGANMTVRAFFERLERISGVKAPAFRMPKSPELSTGLFSLYESAIKRLGGTPPIDKEDVLIGSLYWYCSAAKAERELGFAPRDPGETLRDTVHDLVRRRVVAPKSLRHLAQLPVC